MRFNTTFSAILSIFCASFALAKDPVRFRPKEPARALASATRGAGGGLTVEEAIDTALRDNPDLRVFEASVRASEGAVTTARTLTNPELTVTPGVKRTREGGVATSEFHGEFELSQLFTFPGKRALEIALAQRNVELQQFALEGFRFQLAARVRKVFYEMLAAQNVLGLRKEQVESATAFVESARRRAESGYASDFETLKSQAELIAASKAVKQAQGEAIAARVTLNTFMGKDSAAVLQITGNLENVGTPGSVGDFVALAMARNPSLRTRAKQVEVAGLTLRSTRFGRRPDFAVGPSIEVTDKEQIVGFRGTIALPLWDQKRGDMETAIGEHDKAFADLEKTRAEITSEVTKAAAQFQVARESAALYTPAFLDRLKAFVSQAEQGYAQSTTTLIIYLDAKRTYFDTLSDYYEALGKVAASRAELESAIGVPLEPRKP